MEMMWMTTEQARLEMERRTPVIVPFGSVEQHGPHLPLSTDTIQAYGVALLAAAGTRALVAPPVHYGQCSSTRNHPGTITISADSLRALTRDVIRSLARQGFKRIVLFSGHAGRIHMASLREAAEVMVQEIPDLSLAVVSDLDLVRDTGSDILETPGDGHAGEVETSRMLHLFPERVQGRAPEEYPRFPPYRVVANPEDYWPGGVWGNPNAADAAKGQALVELTAAALAEIVRQMAEEEGAQGTEGK